jgi:3-dehydroquinate synthase
LNFGHTIAHALEAVSGYELLHGEAVALGMLVEAELGQRIGVTDRSVADRLREALEAFRLPLALPQQATAENIVEVMRRDKKVREGTVRFALLKTIGEPAREESGNWTIPVPETVIGDAIGTVR